MVDIPKFSLNADALDITTDEALQEALEKDSKGKKGFEPGNYTLKMTRPRFHENKDSKSILCAKDPTWFNVAVTLTTADGEKSKDYFIQVPTSKVKYGPKGTLFVFRKFVEFMSSIGESVNLKNLAKVVEKYFSSEEALKRLDGKEINVDMAYEGAYAEKEGEQYKIMIPKQGPLQLDGETVYLPDFGSAKVYAEAAGVKLSFVEIVKLHSAVKALKAAGWE